MANRKRESGNFMKPNLDIVKAEIPEQIASRGLVMFPGYTRMLDELPIVFWNIEEDSPPIIRRSWTPRPRPA